MRGLAFVSCLLLSAAANAQAKAVITAPDTGNLGDLIILSSVESEGDVFEWNLVNSDKTYLAMDGNCVFASGSPGTYIFVLSVADHDDLDGTSVSVAVHKLTLGNPEPDTPDPPPSPEPEPQPTPPDRPEPNLTGVAKECFTAMKSVQVAGSEVPDLA